MSAKVVTTQRPVVQNVEEERVVTTEPDGVDIVDRIIWFIAGTLLTLLAFRFILALFGANPENGFADFIYSLSHPFVAPFFSLFNYNFDDGAGRFELFTLIAMAVYAVVAAGLSQLVSIARR